MTALVLGALSNHELRQALSLRPKRRTPPWPKPRPFADLADLDLDRDTIQAPRPLAALWPDAPTPARFPVLSVAMWLPDTPPGPDDALQGRWVLATDRTRRAHVWRTYLYSDARMAVQDIYRGPSARRAVDKLNEDRRMVNWACAHVAGQPDAARALAPVAHDDAFAALAQMRAWLRANPVR